MARAKGFQGIVGRIKAATWGTAVECAALSGIEVTSCVIDGNTQAIEDEQITGVVTQQHADPGNRETSVSLATALRYEGNQFDVAMLMGTAGVPATVDTDARNHVLMINNDIEAIFGTLAYELIKDTMVVECPGVKWKNATFRGRSGERIGLEMAGDGFDFEPASAVNTTTTIDTVTLPTIREYALMSQAVLELNDQNGADFSGDEVYITGFELTIDRPLRATVSTQFGDKPDNPIESGRAKVSGSFEFPAVQSGTGGNSDFIADQLALTRKKAKLTITSPNLAGAATQYYQWVFWLPDLTFGDGKPGIIGPEGPTWSVPFSAWSVTTIPTGFTAGYIGAVVIENFNKETADPLA